MTEENEDRPSRVETLLNRAVTEFDGHMQTIVALIRETNARMDSGFDGVDRRFDKVDLKLGEIEDKVDGVIGVVSNWEREPPQGGV
jgi:hypothetical protein